jgi:hypothetical protein
MARPLVTFLRTQDWGTHPLEWHTVRQWDRLSPSDQPYAKRQHWARADMMEGAKGNGLEFLAIHRSMIRLLTARFPKNGDLFAGWTAPPTVNGDANDPSTDSAAFDPRRGQERRPPQLPPLPIPGRTQQDRHGRPVGEPPEQAVLAGHGGRSGAASVSSSSS